MKKELEQRLYAFFPKLFRQHKLLASESCMCWGICCGDGWFKLLFNLCKYMQNAIKMNNHHPQIEFAQIKQKLSRLCIYIDYIPPNKEEFEDADHDKCVAEGRSLRNDFHIVIGYVGFLSSYVCEECGKPGERCTINGWLHTLCSKHELCWKNKQKFRII